MKLYPYKTGGGKSLSHAEGWGWVAQRVLRQVKHSSLGHNKFKRVQKVLPA